MVNTYQPTVTNSSELVNTLSTLKNVYYSRVDISEYLHVSNFGWVVIIVNPKNITRMHYSSATSHLDEFFFCVLEMKEDPKRSKNWMILDKI